MIDKNKLIESMAKELAGTYIDDHRDTFGGDDRCGFIKYAWEEFKPDAEAALIALCKELPEHTVSDRSDFPASGMMEGFMKADLINNDLAKYYKQLKAMGKDD